MGVELELLYFDDCPHWREADRLLSVLAAERPDLEVTRQRISSDDEAKRLGFHGSPSIHVGGVDLFEPGPGALPGLTCRMYVTPNGLAGTPTIHQLRDALDSVDHHRW